MPDSITITLPDLSGIPWPEIGPIAVEQRDLIVALAVVLVGVAILLVLVARGRRRRCPFCRERVGGAATLCKHCGSSLLRRKDERRLIQRRRARRRRV